MKFTEWTKCPVCREDVEVTIEITKDKRLLSVNVDPQCEHGQECRRLVMGPGAQWVEDCIDDYRGEPK